MVLFLLYKELFIYQEIIKKESNNKEIYDFFSIIYANSNKSLNFRNIRTRRLLLNFYNFCNFRKSVIQIVNKINNLEIKYIELKLFI